MTPGHDYDDAAAISLRELLQPLARGWRWMVCAPMAAGVLAYGGSYLISPTFSSTTTFLPPQQQQSSAASALASLGALAGLAGGAAGIKSPADQYVALMQSVTVSDRLIERFKLMDVYESKYKMDARKALLENAQITIGKKDGLISVTVEDHDPDRAAAIANQYVDELRRMTNSLALTEAQQRRAFFERQMETSQTKLVQAQQALQASGFSAGALKAEPKAAAEGYARLKAELSATEIKLQTLRANLTQEAPEVKALLATAQALRGQLASAESSNSTSDGGSDYVSKYREFKYQETLADLMTKQFELAKIDESREGALIQVVDEATPGERKVKPKRSIIALSAAFLAFLVMGAILFARSRTALSST